MPYLQKILLFFSTVASVLRPHEFAPWCNLWSHEQINHKGIVISLAQPFPHRYRDVIAECQAYYLTKRAALVIPVARASIADLTSKYSGDHCELFRTTVSFMLHMVEDESLLFHRYFESQEMAQSAQVGKNPPSFEYGTPYVFINSIYLYITYVVHTCIWKLDTICYAVNLF